MKETINGGATGVIEDDVTHTLETYTGYWLRRLQNLFILHWKNHPTASDLGVTPVQGGILILLGDNPGLTQAALARLTSVEPPTLKQALDPLVARGLVRREQSTGDRRIASLTLTPDGESLRGKVEHAAAQHEKIVLSGLDEDERTKLHELLRRAVGQAERLLRTNV